MLMLTSGPFSMDAVMLPLMLMTPGKPVLIRPTVNYRNVPICILNSIPRYKNDNKLSFIQDNNSFFIDKQHLRCHYL